MVFMNIVLIMELIGNQVLFLVDYLMAIILFWLEIFEQCGVQYSQSIQTVTYPPYFTPNGDGFNEYWNINGLLQSYQGKILFLIDMVSFLKEISPNGNGWDGTFNGQPLPSTDYWFKIEYTENGNRQEFKSHFTLKR